jgi:metal-sulfur cluster biosynthetic enzyme
MTREEVVNVLSKVEHPSISYSLMKLGIVTDVELVDNKATIFFAFPFPDIPIGEDLVNSMAEPVEALGLIFDYDIRIMTDYERRTFLKLETEAWKG